MKKHSLFTIKLIVFIIVLSGIYQCFAQETTNGKKDKPQQLSELRDWLFKRETLLLIKSTPIGRFKVPAEARTGIYFDNVEIIDMTNKQTRKGISIFIFNEKSTSELGYIDASEIPKLIKGLKGFASALQQSYTPLYCTKDNIIFTTKGNLIRVQYGVEAVNFSIDRIDEFIGLLQKFSP